MEFHALRAGGDVHVMTTHRAAVDETPLQLISAARLEYLLALEQAVLAYAATIGKLMPPPAGANIAGPG
jgi:hypothetical protein